MKTLLLHVDDDEGGLARVKATLTLADRYGSHIVASHPIPTPTAYAGYPMHGFSQEIIFTLISGEEERARKLKNEFEASLPSLTPSWEWVQETGSPTEVLSLEARTADLTIVGLSAETEGPIGMYSLAGDIALSSKLPVLAVPKDWKVSNEHKKPIVIAWNGSLEASKAVHLAIPLLKGASEVIIAEIGGEKTAQMPAANIANYLARHGLKVETAKLTAPTSVGEAILSVAQSTNAEMIVMGAFGQRRLKEIVFGGVTQELLCNSETSIFLCH